MSDSKLINLGHLRITAEEVDEKFISEDELAAAQEAIDEKYIDEQELADHTHPYAGASVAGGAATSAVKLETARNIRTNLSSTGTASFDGTADATPGVTGILAVKNGGTGYTSVDTTPTSGSSKMVTSGGVYDALGKKVSVSVDSAQNTLIFTV